MRLDKFLSNLGYASRKEIKSYLKKEAVTVNGQIIRDSSYDIDPNNDAVTFFDDPVFYKEKVLLMLNKPKGYLSSNVDEVYPSVLNLFPLKYRRLGLNVAGRLDQDTTGLLLVTNDGILLHNIISPNKEVDKTYLVTTQFPIKDENELLNEMTLLDGNDKPYKTKAKRIKKIDSNHLELTICEGKFHQVKRMIEKIDNQVTDLKRIQIGSLVLPPDLKEGEFKEIELKDIFS